MEEDILLATIASHLTKSSIGFLLENSDGCYIHDNSDNGVYLIKRGSYWFSGFFNNGSVFIVNRVASDLKVIANDIVCSVTFFDLVDLTSKNFPVLHGISPPSKFSKIANFQFYLDESKILSSYQDLSLLIEHCGFKTYRVN